MFKVYILLLLYMYELWPIRIALYVWAFTNLDRSLCLLEGSINLLIENISICTRFLQTCFTPLLAGHVSSLRDLHTICWHVSSLRDLYIICWHVSSLRDLHIICWHVSSLRDLHIICWHVSSLRDLHVICWHVSSLRDLDIICLWVHEWMTGIPCATVVML